MKLMGKRKAIGKWMGSVITYYKFKKKFKGLRVSKY